MIRKRAEKAPRITTLRPLISVCANCNRVLLEGRDPRKQDSWITPGAEMQDVDARRLSHGYCPHCIRILYPDYATRILDR